MCTFIKISPRQHQAPKKQQKTDAFGTFNTKMDEIFIFFGLAGLLQTWVSWIFGWRNKFLTWASSSIILK